MNLTALEIKQQTFEKTFRGYDIDQVKSFLSMVSTEWEHLVGTIRDQENEISRLKDKLNHFKQVEESLHETLQSAKASADQRIEAARNESKSIIQKAEVEAEKILGTVLSQKREIRLGIIKLLDRREEMIRGMRMYLDMADESLNTFARDEASVFKAPVSEEEPVLEKQDQQEQQKAEPVEEKKEQVSQSREQKPQLANDKAGPKYFSTDPDDMDDLLDEIE